MLHCKKLALSLHDYITIKLVTIYDKLVKKLNYLQRGIYPMNINELRLNLKYIYKYIDIRRHTFHLIPSFIAFKCLQKHESNFVTFNNHIRISVTKSWLYGLQLPLYPLLLFYIVLLYANKPRAAMWATEIFFNPNNSWH